MWFILSYLNVICFKYNNINNNKYYFVTYFIYFIKK